MKKRKQPGRKGYSVFRGSRMPMIIGASGQRGHSPVRKGSGACLRKLLYLTENIRPWERAGENEVEGGRRRGREGRSKPIREMSCDFVAGKGRKIPFWAAKKGEENVQ